jgi:hypothetical protein
LSDTAQPPPALPELLLALPVLLLALPVLLLALPVLLLALPVLLLALPVLLLALPVLLLWVPELVELGWVVVVVGVFPPLPPPVLLHALKATAADAKTKSPHNFMPL